MINGVNKRATGFILVFAFLLALLPLDRVSAGELEAVYLYKVFDTDYKAIIVRSNGEMYLIEYGIGAISLPFYEGKIVYIYSPTSIFAGIGSKIIIPDRNQSARIWNAELIGNDLSVVVPKVPAPPAIQTPSVAPKVAAPQAQVKKPAVNVSTVRPVEVRTVDVYLNGEKVEFDVSARIINGRTFVPVRGLVEKLGGTAKWNDSKRIAVLSRPVGKGNIDSIYVALGPDYDVCAKMIVYTDGTEEYVDIALDSKPAMIGGRILIPLRAAMEALGLTVEWDGKNNRVLITE